MHAHDEVVFEEPPKAPTILLDPYQQVAVEHEHGPALCTAGAGSGKTRVLTERISRLVYRGLARPEQILAVTFSRKAAGELRERVAQRLGHEAAKKIHLSTFHALGLSLCREFAGKIGRSKGLTVWDDRSSKAELIAAWNEVVEGLPQGERIKVEQAYSKPPFRELSRILTKTKYAPVSVEDGVLEAAQSLGAHRFRFVNALLQYEEAKKACNAVDYDDLIWIVTRLLIDDEEVRTQVQSRWTFVLVDEYQDTSRLQALMMAQVASSHRNIFVVGDDDQAIYRWRGAEPTNLLDFESDWPGAKICPLGLNYRSTPNIVEWAARSIENNEQRRDKKIWSEAERGLDVKVSSGLDFRDEAEAAIRWLTESLYEDGMGLRDGAMLVRTRRQLLSLQAAASRMQVPSMIVGALAWYQRADARLILGWLRHLANPSDMDAASLILRNWPGVGTQTVSRFRREASDQPGNPLHAPLLKAAKEARSKPLRESLMALHKTLHEVEARVLESLQEAILVIYERAGLNDSIREQKVSEDAKDALDVASREEVKQTLVALSAQHDGTGLLGVFEFLDTLATMAQQDREQDEGQGRITISTIHASKGLEWHAVVVAGAGEGLLPYARNAAQVDEDEDADGAGHIEDERRLYYVACTRAKKRLLLTYPMTMPSFRGPPTAVSPSQFIAESAPEQSPPRTKRTWRREP